MNKIVKIVEKVEVTISATFICASVLLIFLSALSRTFGKPINWAQDFSLLIFAWSVFLGADVALRKDRLVKVELVTAKLPKKGVFILTLITYVIIAIFLGYSVYYGFILVKKTAKRVFPGIAWLSYSWATVSYPIGSLLMLITTALKIKDTIQENMKGGDN